MIQCNMHARRKFSEALKSGDKRAAFAIAIYGAIYGIERECTEQNLTDEQRTVQRMTRTLPELEKLREWSQALLKSGTVLKTTPLYGRYQGDQILDQPLAWFDVFCDWVRLSHAEA